VIRAQVEEIARRAAEGGLDDAGDPELFRLVCFALVSYPSLLPQITRMVTGLAPSDPEFTERWEAFLRVMGERLARP